MAAKGATGDMYEQLIAISEMSFAGGHYEAAYHALMAALYWANDLGDVQRIEAVEQLANKSIGLTLTLWPSNILHSQRRCPVIKASMKL